MPPKLPCAVLTSRKLPAASPVWRLSTPLPCLSDCRPGRGGVLTQCAVEEALNLRLGLKGLTTYAETLSVYGTDDLLGMAMTRPGQGALASAYASRGIKICFTSGTAQTLMGYEEGKSMLYLAGPLPDAAKGAGAQGAQNGAISCVALTAPCRRECGRSWQKPYRGSSRA